MSNSRPEQLDVHGVWHRHGCPATAVTVRPSYLRTGHTYVRCLTCGAFAVVRDEVDASGEEVETS